jgi:NAD(P)-dependent dehydrogenase (short-subunit alcohol dehydrogenase family)
MEITGSVALVTGANRGIGRAIADELLRRGATKVYAAVRNPATVTDPRVVAIELDVTDRDSVAAAARAASDVDLVVNNAGVGGVSTSLSATLDDARAELETNYLGIVSMTQAFAPVLAANGGGAIVNMLSVVSWVGAPHLASYAASKAAAWAYTNASRVQLARQGTQVVGVHVGYVDTDLIASLEVPKLAPSLVAASALDALASGAPEAIVDEFSRTIKAGLSDDQNLIYPAVREQFEAEVAGSA